MVTPVRPLSTSLEAFQSVVQSASEVAVHALTRLVDLDRKDDLRPLASERTEHMWFVKAARMLQFAVLSLFVSGTAWGWSFLLTGLRTERPIESASECRAVAVRSGAAFTALFALAFTKLHPVSIGGTWLFASLMSLYHARQVKELMSEWAPGVQVARKAIDLSRRVFRSRSPAMENNAGCIHGLVVVGYPTPSTPLQRAKSLLGFKPDFPPDVFNALVAHERGHAATLGFFTLVNAVLLRGSLRLAAVVENGVARALKLRSTDAMRRSFWRATGGRIVGVVVASATLISAWTGVAWIDELTADAHAGAPGAVLLPLITKQDRDAYGSVGMRSHPPAALRQLAWQDAPHQLVRKAEPVFRVSSAAIDWIPLRSPPEQQDRK
jgi:hypothetical protein